MPPPSGFICLYSTCLKLVTEVNSVLTLSPHSLFWRSMWMLQRRQFSLCFSDSHSLWSMFLWTYTFSPFCLSLSLCQRPFSSCWSGSFGGWLVMPANGLGCISGMVTIHTRCRHSDVFAAHPTRSLQICSCWWSSGNHNCNSLLTHSALAKVLDLVSWAGNKEKAWILFSICLLLAWASFRICWDMY